LGYSWFKSSALPDFVYHIVLTGLMRIAADKKHAELRYLIEYVFTHVTKSSPDENISDLSEKNPSLLPESALYRLTLKMPR